MTSKNQIDLIVRRMMLVSRMFTKSWGKVQTLKTLKDMIEGPIKQRRIMELVESYQPRMIITKDYEKGDCNYMEGEFYSPLALHAPHLFPEKQMAMCKWKGLFVRGANNKGTVINLAATGDHTFKLREFSFGNDLLKRGISSVLIENPYYGSRKPSNQFRSALANVSDLFVLGATLLVESAFLMQWLRSHDTAPIALTGVSMGGFTACYAACGAPFPVALIPCLSYTTAAPTYCSGALAAAIHWQNLEAELASPHFRRELEEVLDCDWLEQVDTSPRFIGEYARARTFMWILMEQYTNLRAYAPPLCPELVKFVIAEDDAYIVRDGAPTVEEVWPGAQVLRLPNVGHVLAFLQHARSFREVIVEQIEKTATLDARQRQAAVTHAQTPPRDFTSAANGAR